MLPQISPKSYRHNAGPNRFSSHFSTSRTNGPHLLSRVKAGTHSAFGEGSHTAAHTPKHGRFGWGWYHYPRSVPHVSEALRGRVSEWRTLPLFSLGRRRSRRRRGPAGLRRPTPPAERTVLAPISPRVQLCLRRPAFPLSAFIPGA